MLACLPRAVLCSSVYLYRHIAYIPLRIMIAKNDPQMYVLCDPPRWLFSMLHRLSIRNSIWPVKWDIFTRPEPSIYKAVLAWRHFFHLWAKRFNKYKAQAQAGSLNRSYTGSQLKLYHTFPIVSGNGWSLTDYEDVKCTANKSSTTFLNSNT